MPETAARQVGIAVAAAVVLAAMLAGLFLWRAASAGPPPRLPSRPLIVNAPPSWSEPAVTGSGIAIPTTTGEGWRVINQYSAHRVLILEVETEHIGYALGIAEDVIDGVKESYSEVLVYFHRPKRRRVLASARVQWTPRNGYRLLNYEELEP